MKRAAMLLAVVLAITPLQAQESSGGPTNEKAQKTYRQALDYLHRRMTLEALESFKKADKQDDGHCTDCQAKMIQYGTEFQDWKAAESGAAELLASAQGKKDLALAHYQFGVVLWREAQVRHKDELYGRAHEELSKALEAFANFPDALFADGLALGHLKQDDAAKAQFEKFVKMKKPEDAPDRQRALRYISQPDLVRARLAPAFAVTTVDGQRVSLDELQGKVVLIDFWATWCAPCREALPHVKEIAKKFQDQPFVVLSISLDDDDKKWRDFLAKNEMTWPQYCDGGFTGPIARMFGVQAIPHTFTIDADGVLQDEKIGDSSIEGKLKKLVAKARDMQSAGKTAQ